MVPGCLTGESEERETWTAESLRAASSIGNLCPKGWLRKRPIFEKRRRPDETSAVDVSGQHPCRKAAGAGAVRIACTSERARTRVGPRQTL